MSAKTSDQAEGSHRGDPRGKRSGRQAAALRRLDRSALLGLLAALALTLAPLPVAGAPASPDAAGASAAPLVLSDAATIFPAPDQAPILGGDVVVAGGKIVALGKHGQVPLPAGAKTLDCAGLSVLAGFQNSHVHFTEPNWWDADKLPPPALAAHLQAMLTRWGFTTVVDTASFLPNTTAIRKRIESGEVAGPRILTAGAALYPPDGIPYYVKETLPEAVWKTLATPSAPQQATDLVRANLTRGADITKLFTGSWVAHGQVKPMPVDIATAAVEETHHQGKLVFSHPSNLAGLEVALAAHVDVLAHAVEDTRGMTPDHLKRMRAQDMALIPTLKLFAEDSHLYEILDEVRDYQRAGGQLLFGTDVGFLTDYDPTTEYTLLATAGLSWREILATLTTSPAARFGDSARRGRIAPGMDADLAVLATSPVSDPRAFANIRYTLRAGTVIYQAPAAMKP
jgi:imidazolonepropionase-like amidohydrolase